ncbi:hypothetical protein M885DRAFT_507163 [Pelagophyceae sp. CCMP2097]|nr:hypothetical protein M885DRAFT_507163 [Pelagophyceae sp. CCMP2097]
MPGMNGASLRDEFASLGVSQADKRMLTDGPGALARARAAQIMSRKFADRDRVKQRLLEDQEMARARAMAAKAADRKRWKQKTSHSPFLVDLVAENERLDEENKVRLNEENAQSRMLDRQRLALKQQVIVRALREESDLDALRREKRAIVEEERRLKALLDLEKVANHRKNDLLAAERAERQRRSAKNDARRVSNVSRITSVRAQELDLLREFSDVPPVPDNTFSSATLDP